MKRVLHFALLVISAIALLASCEKAPFITMTGPRSFNFTRDGGSQSITFSCNRPWSVSSTESWIQISPSSGEASDKEITVTIKCSPNTTYDPRSATVTVKLEELSESITITQDTGIGLLVSPTIFELTNAAQVIEIEVQKNVQYSVAIDDESAKWIKQGGTKALSTDKVTFTISANESYDNREGKITFKQLDGDLSQTVTVRQSQTNGLFITTPDYNLSNEAHTLSVEVKANVEFEVTSQAEWIKYVETKALTPSTITLSVEANESYDSRTGTVLVKQKNGDLTGTITVNQKQTDYLTISPTSFEVSNADETVTIEVKDNVEYSVVIPDDAKSWISVQSNTQTKALVDDQVVLAIAKNTTYDDREASVTIKQVDGALAGTVKIKQAYGEGLIPDQSSFEINRYGGALDIGIQANVDYEVSTDANWVHYVETKALIASTVVLSIDENPGYTTREATVAIKQKSGGLVANVMVSQNPFGSVEFEGYTYKTVKYGDKEWFAENLRAEFGQETESQTTQWGYYEGLWKSDTYGSIYYMSNLLFHYVYTSWSVEKPERSGKSVCPDGWHVPTSNDWKALFSLSGGDSATPFIKKAYGGTDDYSFGGNYGKWLSASYYLYFDFGQLFREYASISQEGVKYIGNTIEAGHYPDDGFYYVRCVRDPIAPELQTLPIKEMTTTSAVLNAGIKNDPNNDVCRQGYSTLLFNSGFSKITKSGFNYGTSKDNLTSVVYSSGSDVIAEAKSLQPGTVYYYQPFVEYEGGSDRVLGDILSFRTYYSTLDYQGETYYTTLLGNVEMMAQNLRSSKFNDGTAIPFVSDAAEWSAATGPGQCVAFNKDDYLGSLGRLYNGYAIQTGKVCPEGWRLPKYSEIIDENNNNLLNNTILATGALFLPDRKYWVNPVFCSNILGLSLLPSGYRDGGYGNFNGENWQVYIWGLNDADANSLNTINGIMQMGNRGSIEKGKLSEEGRTRGGYAVRCVRVNQ